MASVVSTTTHSLDAVLPANEGASGESRIRTLVIEHYDFVWHSLRRLGVAEATVDDEAQKVFCVLAHRAAGVLPGKEKTFLFGVVIRIAQAARRAAALRAEVMVETTLAQIASSEPRADELLEEARARQVLDRLLNMIPMSLRTVFILYELEEMTMADIASTLSLPPGTVASRLRRARAMFQTLAQKAETEESEGGVR